MQRFRKFRVIWLFAWIAVSFLISIEIKTRIQPDEEKYYFVVTAWNALRPLLFGALLYYASSDACYDFRPSWAYLICAVLLAVFLILNWFYPFARFLRRFQSTGVMLWTLVGFFTMRGLLIPRDGCPAAKTQSM